jgi:hypothetical protein
MSEHVNFWNARNNLRNGNRCGDPSKSPRCGAKARTRGNQPCQAPAVRGSARCRMHGGASTGPRTAAGLERCRRARWKTGEHSVLTIAAKAAEKLRLEQQAEADARHAAAMKRFRRISHARR